MERVNLLCETTRLFLRREDSIRIAGEQHRCSTPNPTTSASPPTTPGQWPALHDSLDAWKVDPVRPVWLNGGARLWNPGRDVQRLQHWETLRRAGLICDWLDGLDATDTERLEDGSLRVDAEALRRICVGYAATWGKA